VRDKHAKFVTLAEARVNKSLKDLQLVGNLSNRAAYEFSEGEVRKIFSALQKGLDAAKARFTRDSDGLNGEFRL
jgi:hypothetical protein